MGAWIMIFIVVLFAIWRISIAVSRRDTSLNGLCNDKNPVETTDDFREWGVLKGFADAIHGHLEEIMRFAEAGDIENYKEARDEWHTFYERLRSHCIQHRLWNPALNDRQVFIPTCKQLRAEERLFASFDEACELGIDTAYDRACMTKDILSYLEDKPRHASVRRVMVNCLAGTDETLKKQYRRVCDRMVSDGILAESHNESGVLVVRKKRKRTPKAVPPFEMEPSVFRPELYTSIDHNLWSKVYYTVGQPEKVDLQKKCCEFHSLSRGEIYHTSLERCTCVAYEMGNRPCKHMVALAKYFHYL